MNQTEQPMNTVSEQAPKPLTIEQEQEQKLRSKYPNPPKQGGSAFIQKMLHKGSKKYFDSGDYNMAKSKKQGLLNGLNKGNLPPSVVACNNMNTNVTTSVTRNENMPPQQQQQQQQPQPQQQQQINNSVDQVMTLSESPVVTNNAPTESTNLTPEITNNSINSTTSVTNSELPNTPNQKPTAFQGSQSSQSIPLLSSSISSDKIAQIQINQQQMLDSEEIGHGIPTPECLPQSRKHSIVQSKLATPRLSSS